MCKTMWVITLLAATSGALFGCVEPNPGYRPERLRSDEPRVDTPGQPGEPGEPAGPGHTPQPPSPTPDAGADDDDGAAPPQPVGCTQRRTYYRDSDGDGYGDPAGQTTTSCGATAPAGYAANDHDCDDSDARVHPNQTSFFEAPAFGAAHSATFGPGGFHFDFDCDSFEVLRHEQEVFCVPNLTTCSGEGWLTGVPFCGETGVYARCAFNDWGDCVPRLRSKRVQSCR